MSDSLLLQVRRSVGYKEGERYEKEDSVVCGVCNCRLHRIVCMGTDAVGADPASQRSGSCPNRRGADERCGVSGATARGALVEPEKRGGTRIERQHVVRRDPVVRFLPAGIAARMRR